MLWAGAVLVHMFVNHISFKCRLSLLEAYIDSVLLLCRLQNLYTFKTRTEFCNLLPNTQLKPVAQHTAGEQFENKLNYFKNKS